MPLEYKVGFTEPLGPVLPEGIAERNPLSNISDPVREVLPLKLYSAPAPINRDSRMRFTSDVFVSVPLVAMEYTVPPPTTAVPPAWAAVLVQVVLLLIAKPEPSPNAP